VPPVSFNSLGVIGAIAVGVPLLLGLVPRLRVPAVVLEIVGGILVGPQVLGWVRYDEPVRIVSDLGLGFLLFLVGYEIDLGILSGGSLGPALGGYGVASLVGLAVSALMWASGQAASPLLVAIVLSSTSLGLLVPVLRDAGELGSQLGRLVCVAGSVAEFVPILLASLFFSATSLDVASRLGEVVGFLALVAVLGGLLVVLYRTGPLTRILQRFEETSSQLGVRLSLTVSLAFALVAIRFNLSGILGSFVAGVVLRASDQRDPATLERFRAKLDALGYGFLVPVFFITTGVTFDAWALYSSPYAALRVPVFLAALAVSRLLATPLYRARLGPRRAVAAGLLQATNLTFVVVGVELGLQLGRLSPLNGAALLVAGVLSVLVFPQLGLRVLGTRGAASA
jgi:Kef-type K+ transport system membrane component KefB